jgi:hypothetical protein
MSGSDRASNYVARLCVASTHNLQRIASSSGVILALGRVVAHLNKDLSLWNMLRDHRISMLRWARTSSRVSRRIEGSCAATLANCAR